MTGEGVCSLCGADPVWGQWSEGCPRCAEMGSCVWPGAGWWCGDHLYATNDNRVGFFKKSDCPACLGHNTPAALRLVPLCRYDGRTELDGCGRAAQGGPPTTKEMNVIFCPHCECPITRDDQARNLCPTCKEDPNSSTPSIRQEGTRAPTTKPPTFEDVFGGAVQPLPNIGAPWPVVPDAAPPQPAGGHAVRSTDLPGSRVGRPLTFVPFKTPERPFGDVAGCIVRQCDVCGKDTKGATQCPAGHTDCPLTPTLPPAASKVPRLVLYLLSLRVPVTEGDMMLGSLGRGFLRWAGLPGQRVFHVVQLEVYIPEGLADNLARDETRQGLNRWFANEMGMKVECLGGRRVGDR